MNHRYLLIAATRTAIPGVVVAAKRLIEVDPETPRTIVVVDGDPHAVGALQDLGTVCTGGDLGLTDDELGLWAAAYGPQGIEWASFPHILRAVGQPGEAILWLSGDIEVVTHPQPIWQALETTELVVASAAPRLTPHEHDAPDSSNGRPRNLQPVTAVAEHDGELIARSLLGWQVGSVAIERALASWPVPRDHPTHECVARREIAQVWFNALALDREVAVVENRGIVLSVAQLLDREVGPGPTIDGAPLSLLGLRGFDAERPHLLEGAVRTARLSDRPDLAPVLRRRSEDLLAAGWVYVDPSTEPGSRWSAYASGLPNSELVQGVARAGIRAGAITNSPFTPSGYVQLTAWLTGKARTGGSIGVNRLLAAVHASRPDLHAAYPSLDGPDGIGFLGWAWVYGRQELSIPDSLLPPKPAFLDAAPAERATQPKAPDVPGVNVAGYFTSELGLGESARQIASALESVGVQTTAVQGLLVPPTRQQAEFQPVGPQDARHDVNVVVVNGDQMPAFARDVGEGFFEGRPTVGVWWWEVDPFPAEEWSASLEWLDEIWVGTEFIRGLVEPHVDVPVWVFPVPVSVHQLETPIERAHFGFRDDEILFLYVWDYHSTESRKNPSGLVEAYRRAFPAGSPHKTRLVLKCINHENLPDADEKVRLAAAGREDITFIDRFLSGREKNGLLELCDCYVSPHRSEGFGYTPAEAMLLGKPVVVTAYGGTTQYTDDSVARMVRCTETTVGRGALPYPPDGRWADPDLDDLADALRWIVEQPAEAAAMAERGRAKVAAQHSLATSGTAMAARVAHLRARHASSSVRAAQPGASSDAPTNPSRAGTAARLVKRGAKAVPGATGLRRRWWSMQDRSVEARTSGLRSAVAELDAKARDRAREQQDLRERVDAEVAAVAGVTDELDRAREVLAGEIHELAVRERTIEQRLALLEHQVQRHRDQHSAAPWVPEDAGFATEELPGIGRAFGARDWSQTGDRYADFLAIFRGPYERVLDLVRPYEVVLRGHGPLLDIGCGRGELLEIAADAGIEARGVDLDVELVNQAVARGHAAETGDGLAVLREAADGSLGCVSAIHVVEHLSVRDLVAFFTEALRALRPGGILLVETINPHEVSAASTFWVDPTHRGPVFPQVALALALTTGFSSAHVYAPDGHGDWEVDRLESTRYTLLARR